MKTQSISLSAIIVRLEGYCQLAGRSALLYDNRYDIFILDGFCICEMMLQYLVQQKNLIEQAQSYPTVFSFCVKSEWLPEEIRNYLVIIMRIRNRSAHQFNGEINTAETALEFYKALFFFSVWFDKEANAKGKVIEAYSSSHFNNLDFSVAEGDIKFANTFPTRIVLGASSGLVAPTIYERKGQDAKYILMALEELKQTVERIDLRTINMDQRDERMEQTINQISEQITNLTNQISSFQSLVQRQIQISVSDEEKERIIQAFTDECVPRIVENMKANNEGIRFEQEKKKLIASLGKSAWGKMSDTSHLFLISSKVMYNDLILLDDAIDYSGVCLLITKALEVELKKRFFHGFLNYLDDTYKKDYSVYPTSLLFRKAPKTEEQFSLGTIPFILCYCDSKTDSLSQSNNNRQKLLEYSKNCLLSKLSNGEIDAVLNEYANRVESVRESFRNPAAHTNEINRTTAEECFNIIIDVEKLLKKMLDSFDY